MHIVGGGWFAYSHVWEDHGPHRCVKNTARDMRFGSFLPRLPLFSFLVIFKGGGRVRPVLSYFCSTLGLGPGDFLAHRVLISLSRRAWESRLEGSPGLSYMIINRPEFES